MRKARTVLIEGFVLRCLVLSPILGFCIRLFALRENGAELDKLNCVILH